MKFKIELMSYEYLMSEYIEVDKNNNFTKYREKKSRRILFKLSEKRKNIVLIKESMGLYMIENKLEKTKMEKTNMKEIIKKLKRKNVYDIKYINLLIKQILIKLRVVGIGYKLAKKGRTTIFKIGYAHNFFNILRKGVVVYEKIKKKKNYIFGSDFRSILMILVMLLGSLRVVSLYTSKGVQKLNE